MINIIIINRIVMKAISVANRLSEKINWFPGHMQKALRLMR